MREALAKAHRSRLGASDSSISTFPKSSYAAYGFSDSSSGPNSPEGETVSVVIQQAVANVDLYFKEMVDAPSFSAKDPKFERFDWWSKQGTTTYPYVVPAALRYLCITPSSSETERFFKVCTNLCLGEILKRLCRF